VIEMRLPILLSLTVALGAWAHDRRLPGVQPQSAEPVMTVANTHPDQHVLLLIQMSPDRVRVTQQQVVQMPLPVDRTPTVLPWKVEVLDAGGTVLYAAGIPAANEVRGELARESGEIRHAHAQTLICNVMLRLPRLPGAATIRISGKAGSLPKGDPRKIDQDDLMIELGTLTFPQ
jgi:hypothetical protein